MNTKVVNFLNRDWVWPKYDTDLLAVSEYVEDVNRIVPYLISTNTVIQAGGACGVWPVAFSKLFKNVISFEPDPLNYFCLSENTIGISNIKAVNAALGDVGGVVSLVRSEEHKNNCGAGYAIYGSGANIPVISIDSLGLESCDLIQLDVEGWEFSVLLGGANTIKKFKPVIVLEEKQHKHFKQSHTKAREFLVNLGYKEATRFHRDVLFVC